MNEKTSFYLLTDSHYVSPKIWVEGDPMTHRERGDQIALKATPQILDAFFEKILADHETDTVVFLGDNVNNGDMQSHEDFRSSLHRLITAGKKVYLVCATHDYCGAGDDENFFMSCRYTETGSEPIPFMRKHELFDYYYEFGPKQALSVHKESGSYTVQLGAHADVFSRSTALHLHYKPDIEAMQTAAACVLGTHDFNAFKCSGSNMENTVRTVYRSEWIKDGKYLTYFVEGNGFLYNMVRILVGTMLEIGSGKRSVSDMQKAIKSGNRSDAGATAPAHGLCLIRVLYPEFDTEEVLNRD